MPGLPWAAPPDRTLDVLNDRGNAAFAPQPLGGLPGLRVRCLMQPVTITRIGPPSCRIFRARRARHDAPCTPEPPPVEGPHVLEHELAGVNLREPRVVIEAHDAIALPQEAFRPPAEAAEQVDAERAFIHPSHPPRERVCGRRPPRDRAPPQWPCTCAQRPAARVQRAHPREWASSPGPTRRGPDRLHGDGGAAPPPRGGGHLPPAPRGAPLIACTVTAGRRPCLEALGAAGRLPIRQPREEEK